MKDSGITVIDVMVGCAALALVGCIILPGLAKERDDARTAQCADHQKQLAQAAHQYAADFEGKFFYNRSKKSDHNRQYKPELVGYWYDQERVGRYIDGTPMYLEWKHFQHPRAPERIPNEPPIDWPRIGIGGGVFVCPSDSDNAGRSYNMNYWAGTGYSLHPDEKIPWPHGQLFDSASEGLDKLLLFTDVMGFTLTARGWVCDKKFGNQLFPGQRFGGIDDPYSGPDLFQRYGFIRSYRTQIDYGRHGENRDRLTPTGDVNIAYADGHVGLRSIDNLVNSTTNLSTYDTLWSPIDREIEARIVD